MTLLITLKIVLQFILDIIGVIFYENKEEINYIKGNFRGLNLNKNKVQTNDY